MADAWDAQPAPVYGERIALQDDSRNAGPISPANATERFLAFIRNFRHENVFVYRDQLRRRFHLGQYFLEVELRDLAAFNGTLADLLVARPAEFLPLFENAARAAAAAVVHAQGEEERARELREIQVMLRSDGNPMQIRELTSDYISKLVKIPGIIISASTPRARATHLTIRCSNCSHTQQLPVASGFGGISLPRKCPTNDNPQANQERCPLDPYMIDGDKCLCIDQQTLKLQEHPEVVPTGELPRHMLLSSDRYLCGRVVPGMRVTIMGIYSIFQSRGSSAVATRNPYIRVVGMTVDTDGPGRASSQFSPEDEEAFIKMARGGDVYAELAKNIAPSIFGSLDIKKAIACLLFGGSRKRLPDGLRVRGDINVLLLGDPGTAKSQFLKFVEKVAPIGVYTSGKGSSAAGLTASVVREGSSREFYLEGGAMVLADGGVVCVDEFDKMRESDRVAIHEAMEQQTISIAKAGITTILNSRTSVLAAANSVFGRWDDTKGAEDNMDFQTTILSRFDMIFIIKDEHDEAKDTSIARHVMQVHLNANEAPDMETMDLQFLKKYINYCRTRCGPRISDEAADKLRNHFVAIRKAAKDQERQSGKRSSIPITIRQLEAIIRISESRAKMTLTPFATIEDVAEAIRLFKVSTLDAALSGDIIGAEGGAVRPELQDELSKIEKQIQRRFFVGAQVSEKRIVEDFVKQGFSEYGIKKVISVMLRRGDLQHKAQRKVLLRVR
ncbi:minichromosome maintenance complex component 5 [Capsaspora owczarzaki ATCC 30864]|uniref:DNA replication licensing factor MCM5 n=1 Tax=Capsaspora owczarzaki (strain ATCC 30864) TaxID=595528 RepID=A0A0D2U8G0_CAPO3|nr:minichromosome maintenance complex component 5 [Capsaspora owczarzaki ATCC 30864]KJE91381.1 minichromosome maintenance complex component 5, variant [Capsaspora owczarzaki ATCC 30864]|eukprot:XP_004349270.1 minichromosome maintenance complex component 5 [Capsaspora owczarzaki ATCC 30864]